MGNLIMDTAPPPFPLSPQRTNRSFLSAWPRSAQLATAFLLGVSATSLFLHFLISSRWWTRPTDLERGSVPAYRVDLNKASRAELMQMPGVGERMADRIEEQRRVRGGFRKADDLKTVKGVGTATVDRLRNWVEVDDADPADLLDPEPKPVKLKASSSRKKVPAARVDVNRSSLEELKEIPGVGPSYAQHIIDERRKKPFEKVEDLTRVPGIKERKLDALRPYVTVTQLIDVAR
jgi:competence ComEA-like helix-hairpin-helix protein